MNGSDEKRTVRREVELPGTPTDKTLAECFGLVVTDEARAEFQRTMDAITEAERKADQHLHDRIYGGRHA